jgi:amidase
MTAIPDYDSYDALGLAELVRKGEVSAGELLDEAIARVEATNPVINAFTVRFYDRARDAIAAGLPEGPLSGVPFPLKDLGAALEGTPLTNGSRLFEHYVCDTTSTLVERFMAAGLVPFGRTNSPEFGLSYATEPTLHGPTRNPWNLDHIPGGSSGGAAAAVAARVVPAAHASDGGGSIRVPASCCGLFGLKPSRGRTPSGPTESDGWAGMTIGHAVTRSVRDSAAILDAISGPEPGDPYAAPAQARPFLSEVGAKPGKLRIAFSGRTPSDHPVHPDCIAAMADAARLCADLGHHVGEAEPDYDRELIDPARADIIAAYCRADVEESAALFGVEPGTLLEPSTVAFATMADGIKGTAVAAAITTMRRVTRQIGRFFEDYDVLITPQLAQPPLKIGELNPAPVDMEAYFATVFGFSGFPGLSNATGCPAMSMPLHWNDDNLPIGTQFIARLGDEATLLRLAAQIEQARPWAHKRPDLG